MSTAICLNLDQSKILLIWHSSPAFDIIVINKVYNPKNSTEIGVVYFPLSKISENIMLIYFVLQFYFMEFFLYPRKTNVFGGILESACLYICQFVFPSMCLSVCKIPKILYLKLLLQFCFKCLETLWIN